MNAHAPSGRFHNLPWLHAMIEMVAVAVEARVSPAMHAKSCLGSWYNNLLDSQPRSLIMLHGAYSSATLK